MPQIEKDYMKTKKIKHVFMDFPLPMHSLAMKASEAGLCAGDQKKFWQMHDLLFANQHALKQEDLIKHAETLGLDMVNFKKCLDSGKHISDIKTSIAEGQKATVTGTPAFLLGFTESEGKVKAVKKISGARPYTTFKETIEGLLKSAEKK
jgi:protein-disulfide isomerase